MKAAADIRKCNKKAIYKLMVDGNRYTKNKVSRILNLSVATCNTLLNDMKNQGLVLDTEKKSAEVGRNSVLYQIDANHEYYLSVYLQMINKKRVVEVVVFNALGHKVSSNTQIYDFFDESSLAEIINENIKKQSKIVHVIIAMPGIVKSHIIRYCDISEFNDIDLKSYLEKQFKIKITIQNDVHIEALGYYELKNEKYKVVTLGYFPTNVLPGMATIHEGMVIKGTKGFAGMMGFLNYGLTREQLIEKLDLQNCVPYVTTAVNAAIVMLNPDTIVLTGELINSENIEIIKNNCMNNIPEEYMPKFEMVDSFKEFLHQGFFQIALEEKIIE